MPNSETCLDSRVYLDSGNCFWIMVPRAETTATSVKRDELQLTVSACGAKRARTATGIESGKPGMGAIGGQLQLEKKCVVKNNDNLVEHKQSFSYL